jgi:hypothetical protein
MRPIHGPTLGACLGRVRRVIEMKSLIVTAVVGLCAFAGAGLGISAVVSSNAAASTAVSSGPPVGANGVVATVSQLTPGPANPGGAYAFVTTPCHPVSCS